MLQLDGLDGVFAGGPQRVSPAIAHDRPLGPQFDSVRRLDAFLHHRREQPNVGLRFGRLVEALRVGDAIAAGASQREIGLGIHGGYWPGDGEHLKSRVRRMIILAAHLARVGPLGVLAGRI